MNYPREYLLQLQPHRQVKRKCELRENDFNSLKPFFNQKEDKVCVVKTYIGEKKEENKVMEEVSRYEFNFKDKSLDAHPVLGESRKFEFKNIDKIKWSEQDDSLVIEGRFK